MAQEDGGIYPSIDTSAQGATSAPETLGNNVNFTNEDVQWLFSALCTNPGVRRLIRLNGLISPNNVESYKSEFLKDNAGPVDPNSISMTYDRSNKKLTLSYKLNGDLEEKTKVLEDKTFKTTAQIDLLQLIKREDGVSRKLDELRWLDRDGWSEIGVPFSDFLDKNTSYGVYEADVTEAVDGAPAVTTQGKKIGDVIDGFGIAPDDLPKKLRENDNTRGTALCYQRKLSNSQIELKFRVHDMQGGITDRHFVLTPTPLTDVSASGKESNSEIFDGNAVSIRVENRFKEKLRQKLLEIAAAEPDLSYEVVGTKFEDWVRKQLASLSSNKDETLVPFLTGLLEFSPSELLGIKKGGFFRKESVAVRSERVRSLTIALRNTLMNTNTAKEIFQDWRTVQESKNALEACLKSAEKSWINRAFRRDGSSTDTPLGQQIRQSIIDESGLFDQNGKAKDEVCTPAEVAKLIEHLSALEVFFSTEFRANRHAAIILRDTIHSTQVQSLSSLVTGELQQILALESIPTPPLWDADNYASKVDMILNQLVSQVNYLSQSTGTNPDRIEIIYADVARVMRERIKKYIENASISAKVDSQKTSIRQSTASRFKILNAQEATAEVSDELYTSTRRGNATAFQPTRPPWMSNP